MDETKKEEHPSYGLLQISRIRGGGGHLFGSAVENRNCIRVRIKRATLHRSLYHTSYYDTRGHDIVEVDLSPAQWAEAITSLNTGCGTPCTIRYIDGVCMPNPPYKNQREEVRDEFKEKMHNLAETTEVKAGGIKAILAEKKSLNKADREYITGLLDKVVMELKSNIPFVHQMFDEAVDKTLTQAKAEIEAFMTTTVMNVGYQALASANTPTTIPSLDFTNPNPEVKP